MSGCGSDVKTAQSAASATGTPRGMSTMQICGRGGRRCVRVTLSQEVRQGHSRRLPGRTHREPLRDVVHGEGGRDEEAEPSPRSRSGSPGGGTFAPASAVAPKRHAEPDPLGERVHCHDGEDEEHALRINACERRGRGGRERAPREPPPRRGEEGTHAPSNPLNLSPS